MTNGEVLNSETDRAEPEPVTDAILGSPVTRSSRLPTTGSTLLEMRKIVKVFSGVVALDNVDLTLQVGEVHSLVGENGAGKSTLIKVMTGAYSRDGGEIFLDGKSVNFRSPEDAQVAGVVAVYQEVNLLMFRSV